MGTAGNLRSRRHVAERHALARVERDIRAEDRNGRLKYVQDFRGAFPSYRSVLTEAEVRGQLAASDIVLVADYHALPASQRYAARILEAMCASGRKVVLALEPVLARDQHILDEWMQGEVAEDELRDRLRFDLEWGYAWEPFLGLLETARRHAAAAYGLDCMPRHDMRRIAARDKHAAAKIAEVRERHPSAALLALFGESHLAPNHLPRWLAERRPQDRVTTLLQNVDALYWQAAGEKLERVEAARVSPGVICVFNASPLEKYESYRMCIERWRQQPTASPDLAPTVYNLVDSLLDFLHIDKYSSHNGTQPRFLVDLFPEVYARQDLDALRRLLLRKRAGEEEARSAIRHIHEHGCRYLPRMNAIFVHQVQLADCAQEAARFVHHACRGLAGSDAGRPASPQDLFCRRVLEEALGHVGSRALYPRRPAAGEAAGGATIGSLQQCLPQDGERFDAVTRQAGALLGSALYDDYVAGRLSRRSLRALFFRDLETPGAASSLYARVAERCALGKSRPA